LNIKISEHMYTFLTDKMAVLSKNINNVTSQENTKAIHVCRMGLNELKVICTIKILNVLDLIVGGKD